MWLAVTVQAIIAVCRTIALAFGLAGEDRGAIDGVLGAVLAGLTSGCMFAASRRVTMPGQRRAWQIMSLGMSMSAVGFVLCLLVGLANGGETPFPSIADAAYLLCYPLVLIGMLTFPRPAEASSERLKFWLDALITVVGGGLVFWYFLIYPIALASDASGLAALVGVAYPVADLVLILAFATVTLRATDSLSRRASILLGGTVGCQILADLAYGGLTVSQQYVAGEPITLLIEVPAQIAVLCGSLAAYVAVRDSRRTPIDRGGEVRPARRLTVLPYLAILLGYGLLLYVSFGEGHERVQGVIVGAVLLTGLVVARQIAAVRENGRLQAIQAARRSEARFRSLVQHSSDVITIVDAAGDAVYVSPSVERVFGYPPESMIGRQVLDLLHPDDLARGQELMATPRHSTSSAGSTVSLRFQHQDGRWRHVEIVVSNLLDDPDVAGLVFTIRDDTERRALAEELRHQAFHDTLTGLANRALFEDRLAHALARAERTSQSVAVVFLDLDNFKTVNDSLGHSAGDEVLATVARRILHVIRGSDTAARFGGDELAILIEDMTPGRAVVDEAIRVAERLLAICRQPFLVKDREVVIGCSIGIAVSPSGRETADALLRDADLAMYSAKERGKSRYEVFQPEMHARAVEQVELQADLRLAIDRRELVVHYQPIYALATNRISGLEALVRWNHPTRGLLSPAAFIPQAEETGLIVPLGFAVLRQACQDAQAWAKRYPAAGPLTVTVNLSVRQLDDPACVAEVLAALGQSGLPPDRLVLEITESFMIKDPDVAVARLTDLRRLGLRLALDDFGTGFSSLSYLQRLPVDVLKIDRAFVDKMVSTGRDSSLVEAILALGKSLRLQVVAEGIERPDQLALLRALGCGYGQGYLLSRPLHHAAAEMLLAAQQGTSGQPALREPASGGVAVSL